MSNKFYIVNDRAFKNKTIAINYCLLNGLDPNESVITTAAVENKEKYYLLKTRGMNRGIESLTWLTLTQLNSTRWIEELERLKSNKYTTSYVSLNEVSEREYNKALKTLREEYGENFIKRLINA